MGRNLNITIQKYKDELDRIYGVGKPVFKLSTNNIELYRKIKQASVIRHLTIPQLIELCGHEYITESNQYPDRKQKFYDIAKEIFENSESLKANGYLSFEEISKINKLAKKLETTPTALAKLFGYSELSLFNLEHLSHISLENIKLYLSIKYPNTNILLNLSSTDYYFYHVLYKYGEAHNMSVKDVAEMCGYHYISNSGRKISNIDRSKEEITTELLNTYPDGNVDLEDLNKNHHKLYLEIKRIANEQKNNLEEYILFAVGLGITTPNQKLNEQRFELIQQRLIELFPDKIIKRLTLIPNKLQTAIKNYLRDSNTTTMLEFLNDLGYYVILPRQDSIKAFAQLSTLLKNALDEAFDSQEVSLEALQNNSSLYELVIRSARLMNCNLETAFEYAEHTLVNQVNTRENENEIQL